MDAAIDGVTVTNASTLIVPDSRNNSVEWKSVIITNAGSTDAFLSRGVEAQLNKGIFIRANGGSVVLDNRRAGLPVYGIVASGSTLITYSAV